MPSDQELARCAARAREAAERRERERRRALLVLVQRWLADAGYADAAERLGTQCGVPLSKVRSRARLRMGEGGAANRAAACRAPLW
jgi:hypothetical protein